MPEEKPYVIKEIVVTGVSHLIPANVSCTIDDQATVLTVYVDYKDTSIHLPKETSDELGDADDKFRQALLDFYAKEREEITRRHEEEYPAREAPRTEVQPHPEHRDDL